MDRARESSLSYASGDGTGDFRSGDFDAGDGDVAGTGRFRHDPDSPLAITLVTRIATGARKHPRDTAFVVRPHGVRARGPAL